ncbi:serine/threonine-protein kinase-like protein At5g23170 [Manihot esculenta]|uniref:non-specific serine/threonine protein kinase n=1 Tax=Manihot esculenta TaxID=3983 RepID=A0A2C9VHR8_MANES|nr:serine/threonine-protein kinase-like protein At5g23170 [Manihot esculenta]OAY44982.1 hypothetical protein MANES_07G022300v8 [Manihot esculenta]
MADFDYQDLLQATDGFSPSRLIGKGSHGSVYKGILFQENKVLAIKKPSIGIDHVSNDNSKKLDNEIFILSSLRDRSPYIIGFLGTSHDSAAASSEEKKIINNRKLLVMEFMPNGSLHEMLHGAQTPPSWPKRVEIALQIARAIQVLHESKPLVIHRDIKSTNILFDSNWNVKLADYGLAVLSRADSSSHQTIQPAGTIGYIDPCYTTPSKLSTKNDVFSYGVVLLEIISSRKAIDVSKGPASIVEWAVPLIQKQRLPIKEICDPRLGLPPYMESTIRNLLNLAVRCVSSKEETRPSISELIMGMGSHCLVERVNIAPNPRSWTSLVRSLIVMRKKRRLSKKWQGKCEEYSEISKGKILLREILADITLK